MDITLNPINEKDGEALLRFEIENRIFFEETCMPRGDEYYNKENFMNILNELIKEQSLGIHYMYLVKDNKGEIVGRINLVDVIRGPINKAELGYRIGKNHKGKGYGKKAIAIILKEAINIHKIHRIEAGTSKENIASQKILEHNGFRNVGVFKEYIYFNGKWNDSIVYEKILK